MGYGEGVGGGRGFSSEVDEVVEETSPQDVGLLEKVGGSRIDAQVVDYHAFGVTRLDPLHLHSEIAIGKDVPGNTSEALHWYYLTVWKAKDGTSECRWRGLSRAIPKAW